MVNWLFKMAVEIYGYYLNWDRYGWLKHYPKNYEFSKDLVVDELKNFLLEAGKVKFWKQRFAEFDVNIEAQDLSLEILKLPVLTKAEVKSSVVSPKYSSFVKLWFGVKLSKTSGSTGNGLVFQTSRSFRRYQWMVWFRHFKHNEVPISSYRLWLGGRTFFPRFYNKPFLVVKSTKTIYLNVYTYAPSDEEELLKIMNKHSVNWIHGYPSTVFAFIKGFKNIQGLRDLITSVTVSSENLEKTVSNFIESEIQARVIEHYGQSEGVANLSFDGTRWNNDEDFALIQYEQTENGLYKIIGTGYRNTAFPLIRYDTDDLVLINKGEVQDIHGRSDDYISLPSGRKLYRMDHLFKGIEGLYMTQIRQSDLRILEIHYQAGSILETDALELVQSRFLKMTSEDIELRFIRTNSFVKSKSGKVKGVVRSKEL